MGAATKEIALEFHNEPVDPDTLPAWEAVELEPISPRYAPCRLLTIGGWSALAAAAVALSPPLEAFPLAGDWRMAAGVFAAGALAAAIAWMEARRRAWGLREHDLIYRSGLIVRRTVVLPLARVQHVETISGPLERAFGLVRLACYTAGGLSTDLVVAGLERDTAERVRHYLLGRIGALDDAEAGDDE